MQFATPWQFANGLPQVWTTNGIQSQALIAPNPILIRGMQPDGTPGPGMFIHQSPQAATIQASQNSTILCIYFFIKNILYICYCSSSNGSRNSTTGW